MVYDVIIIGGGPAGLSAAIYSSRSGLKTLLIEREMIGGHLIITDFIENYPGFDKGVNGFDLSLKLQTQAETFGAEIISAEIKNVSDGLIKKIITEESEYQAKALIIAAGTSIRKLDIDGEFELTGKGVSYCAVCDAPLFKGKDTAVIGGGDSALQEAIYLSKFAKSVKIIHRRDTFRASKNLQDKALNTSNISVIYDSVPLEIKGLERVEKLIISNVKTQKKEELELSAVFVFIGLIPNTALFSFLKLDESGYILTDENMQTSSKGIFACGDIRQKNLRQIITAASDGAIAAIEAEKFLQ